MLHALTRFLSCKTAALKKLLNWNKTAIRKQENTSELKKKVIGIPIQPAISNTPEPEAIAVHEVKSNHRKVENNVVITLRIEEAETVAIPKSPTCANPLNRKRNKKAMNR